ncbi:hypothetical protein AB3N61_09310 [Leptospira sp. WS58.C1]|uniref:hypothetical protein n=1 Tax=Leptospira cinconiae TaxID=3235173 RepID=UPI00349EC522
MLTGILNNLTSVAIPKVSAGVTTGVNTAINSAIEKGLNSLFTPKPPKNNLNDILSIASALRPPATVATPIRKATSTPALPPEIKLGQEASAGNDDIMKYALIGAGVLGAVFILPKLIKG